VTTLDAGTKVFQVFVPNDKYKEYDDGGVEKRPEQKKEGSVYSD